MVQEFHVLRCFSCRTFQVQQVKKCRRWSCKMCGEKQSRVKEYGGGSGADCRRHVQKLNSLCGGLLEVEHEKARARWEDEVCKDEEGTGDSSQTSEPKRETRVVSRWSKFVDRTNNCPEDEDEDDDDDDEDDVSTERRWSQKHNDLRRRKPVMDAPRHDEGRETHLNTKRLPFRQKNRSDAFRSSPPIRQALTEPPVSTRPPLSSGQHSTSSLCTGPVTLTLGQPRGPSSGSSTPPPGDKGRGEAKPLAQGSKWTRFLCSSSTDHDDDDEGDEGTLSSQQTISASAQSSAENTRYLKDDPRPDRNVVSCLGGGRPQGRHGPTLATGMPNPVSPVKKPRLPFNAMFCTDEDFNDAY